MEMKMMMMERGTNTQDNHKTQLSLMDIRIK